LSGCAKREGFNASLGNDLIGSFDEGGAQIAVMVGRSFSRHIQFVS
jgi:hypothetical protein